MSKAQKWVLAIGLLLMAMAALFPPRFHIGSQSPVNRAFLYDGTFASPHSINIEKLVVEWMFLAAITASGVVAGVNHSKGSSRGGNSQKSSTGT